MYWAPFNESRMSTPHKGSSCSAWNLPWEKKQLNNFEFAFAVLQTHVINGMFLPAALMAGRSRPDFHLLHIYHSLACSPSREGIPLTALTEATLVGKCPHSRFGLTGLTGLTLSDGAGHDLFVR